MIKLQAIGNLGKDCVTNTVNGKSVINFNVAHTEKFRDAQGNQKDKTIWVECAYWTDKTAIAPYLRKGTQVYVDGIPEVRTYTKNDGTPAASLNLRVLSVQLLGTRGDNVSPAQNNYSAPAAATAGNNAPAHQMSEPADDLPF
jgi:single-strand DNA-binding protein